MRLFRNRRILFGSIFAAAAILLLVAIILTNRQPPAGVKITLIGYTNGGNWPFAVFTLSNGDSVPIQSRGYFSEVEGNGNLLAPVINFNLPRLTNITLSASESVVFAVGQPTDGERWRISYRFNRVTRKQRVKQYLWQHRNSFPIKLFKVSQPQLQIQTNYSDWFEMQPPVKQK
jgi:hypothetical protein